MWLHEIKYGGYRMPLVKTGDRVGVARYIPL